MDRRKLVSRGLSIAILAAMAACWPALAADVVGLAKSASIHGDRDGAFLITYELVAANLGTGELRNVVIEDDLAEAFADLPFEVVAVESETASLRPDFDGRTVIALLDGTDRLAAGQALAAAVTVRVRIGEQPVAISNTATARATGSSGPLSDRSHAGTEPDPNWDGVAQDHGDPTVVTLTPRGILGAAKETQSVTRREDGTYDVVFSIHVENAGQLALRAVNVQDNLVLAFPPPAAATVFSLESPDFEVNPAYDGVRELRLLAGRDALDPSQGGDIALGVRVSPNGGRAWFENRALASATTAAGASVLDFSDAGADIDPDGDGDPTNNERPTDVVLAQTSLSGFAESTIRLDTPPLDLVLESLVLNVNLRIDELAARLDAKLTDSSFDLLSISLSSPFGPLTAASAVTFNPSTLRFVWWQTNVSLDVLGVAVTDTFFIANPAEDSYMMLRASGAAGPFDLDVSVKLGVCPLEFWETTLCGDWEWSVCETPLSACLAFDGDHGFASLAVTARDLELFANIFGVAATLDVRIDYSVDEKSVTPSIRFAPDWAICTEIEFLGEAVLTSSGFGVESIRLYGAKAEVQVGDVVFRAADSFYDETNARVTGKAAYFEVFQIETSIPSCCGSPGRIEGSVYFERSPAPSGGLLGVGLLAGEAELRVTGHVLVGLSVDCVPSAPLWTFTARVRALW